MNYLCQDLSPFGVIVEPLTQGDQLTQINIEALRKLFHQHHLVVLRGFDSFKTAEEFSHFCSRLGQISLWPFGKVLELIEQKNPSDHIFDHNYVPLHWDGMYRPQVPQYQVFHCVAAPKENHGGRTTFANTALAIKHAPKETLNLWSRVTGVYARKMEFYNSKTKAPIVCKHPEHDFLVLRYCEAPKNGDMSFLNHSEISFQGIAQEDVEKLQSTLHEALYADDTFYAHAWKTGDLVIADNYTLLHGREAFTSGSTRHLRRVHVLGSTPLNNPHLVFHS